MISIDGPPEVDLCHEALEALFFGFRRRESRVILRIFL